MRAVYGAMPEGTASGRDTFARPPRPQVHSEFPAPRAQRRCTNRQESEEPGDYDPSYQKGWTRALTISWRDQPTRYDIEACRPTCVAWVLWCAYGGR